MLRRFKAVFVTAVCLTGAVDSAAAQYRFRLGAWSGGAYFFQGGRFSHCAMNATYRSGISLHFSITRDFQFLIGFSKPSWNLRRGTSFPVRYAIDRWILFDGSARVHPRRGNLIVASMPATRRIFNRFRRGFTFHVITRNGRDSFSLRGTNVALTRLLRCTQAHVRAGR